MTPLCMHRCPNKPPHHQVAEAWAERGTLRQSKATAKARWRVLAALVGFSLLASLFRIRAAAR